MPKSPVDQMKEIYLAHGGSEHGFQRFDTIQKFSDIYDDLKDELDEKTKKERTVQRFREWCKNNDLS